MDRTQEVGGSNPPGSIRRQKHPVGLPCWSDGRRDGETASLELIAAPTIEKRVFVVRGRQVMLDEDLADRYGVETKRLVEQVKRNIERFPAGLHVSAG